MEQEVMGVVTAVAKQWWLKVNTKAVRYDPAKPKRATIQYTPTRFLVR